MSAPRSPIRSTSQSLADSHSTNIATTQVRNGQKSTASNGNISPIARPISNAEILRPTTRLTHNGATLYTCSYPGCEKTRRTVERLQSHTEVSGWSRWLLKIANERQNTHTQDVGPSESDMQQQKIDPSNAIVRTQEKDPRIVQPGFKGREGSVSPTNIRRRPSWGRADDVLLIDADLKRVSPSQCMQKSQRRAQQSVNEHRRSSTEELILRESLNQLEIPLQCPVIMCDKLFHFRDDFEYHKAVCIHGFNDSELIFDMVISRRTADSDSISITMAHLPSLILKQTNLVKTYLTERSCAKIAEVVSVADTGLPSTSLDPRIAQTYQRLTQLCWHMNRQTCSRSTE